MGGAGFGLGSGLGFRVQVKVGDPAQAQPVAATPAAAARLTVLPHPPREGQPPSPPFRVRMWNRHLHIGLRLGSAVILVGVVDGR